VERTKEKGIRRDVIRRGFRNNNTSCPDGKALSRGRCNAQKRVDKMAASLVSGRNSKECSTQLALVACPNRVATCSQGRSLSKIDIVGEKREHTEHEEASTPGVDREKLKKSQPPKGSPKNPKAAPPAFKPSSQVKKGETRKKKSPHSAQGSGHQKEISPPRRKAGQVLPREARVEERAR